LQVKNTIKQLKISEEDKENLIKVLEIKDTESSESETLSSSSSESYCSCDSDTSNSPNISFNCKDNCCKTVNVMTKEEEQEELLIELISKVENPEVKQHYLKKLRKLLTKKGSP
jgi:hypothetical protein